MRGSRGGVRGSRGGDVLASRKTLREALEVARLRGGIDNKHTGGINDYFYTNEQRRNDRSRIGYDSEEYESPRSRD